jgi:hypothetical protein
VRPVIRRALQDFVGGAIAVLIILALVRACDKPAEPELMVDDLFIPVAAGPRIDECGRFIHGAPLQKPGRWDGNVVRPSNDKGIA